MPGLFDNSDNSGGIGGILGGLGATLFPGIRRYQLEQQNANTAQQALGPGTQPGMGQLMVTDPAAAQIAIQQRNLQLTHDSLVGTIGPDGRRISDQAAWLLALHPEELGKLTQIQKVGPGEQLQAPFSIFGGGAPTSSQQGAPSTQPGPSNASISGGGGYQGPMNTAGILDQPALETLVDRRLHGDVEAQAEVKAGGISGMNPINNAAFQKLLSQTMQQRGISGGDLARIDAKFPAYKKAQQDLGDMQARMGTAQIEFSKFWPQFMDAVKAWQSRYPGMTQFPSGNAFLQFVDKNAGDPSVAPLKQYTTSLRNIYGRAISTNPRGPTDSDKAHFDEGVNTYWNQGQMESLGNALSNEMSAAQQSIPTMRNVVDVEYGFGKKLDPGTQQQARDAVSRGADKNKVIHRLKENGIDPAGL